ncbi:MAG TPA: YkgJ family cysteine cluster protein [Candidatus Nanoarchaeia archaeon]|nr:YkgJ family cysteine cluster protein [Candidatus Nanoarchaeia archaeon]
MTYPPTNEQSLTRKNFKCTKCGQCCRPIVKVTERDIARIEETGWKREHFLAPDPRKEGSSVKDTLRQKNFVCMFLQKQLDTNGETIFTCSIYDHRPDTCRKYPFFPGKEKIVDCRPERWQYWMDINRLVSED